MAVEVLEQPRFWFFSCWLCDLVGGSVKEDWKKEEHKTSGYTVFGCLCHGGGLTVWIAAVSWFVDLS